MTHSEQCLSANRMGDGFECQCEPPRSVPLLVLAGSHVDGDGRSWRVEVSTSRDEPNALGLHGRALRWRALSAALQALGAEMEMERVEP